MLRASAEWTSVPFGLQYINESDNKTRPGATSRGPIRELFLSFYRSSGTWPGREMRSDRPTVSSSLTPIDFPPVRTRTGFINWRARPGLSGL